jgi:hypothetical protein
MGLKVTVAVQELPAFKEPLQLVCRVKEFVLPPEKMTVLKVNTPVPLFLRVTV